jgi:hypothetical protein
MYLKFSLFNLNGKPTPGYEINPSQGYNQITKYKGMLKVKKIIN